MRARATVVAHRAPMVAEGILAALSEYPEIVPVAAATSTQEIESHAERVDVAALDGELPGAGETAKRLRRKGVRVVFMGESSPEEDGVWVSFASPVSSLAAALVPNIRLDAPDYFENLTSREREVLQLVSRGLAGKQVARQLGISSKTVEHHKTRIFSKLGVSNQTEAAAFAHSANKEGRVR